MDEMSRMTYSTWGLVMSRMTAGPPGQPEETTYGIQEEPLPGRRGESKRPADAATNIH